MKSLLISTAMAAGLVLSSFTAQAATTIKVTLQLPIKHSLGQNWLAFKKIVEKESNGELLVQIFPSAQLYKDKQVPEAVGSGAIEAGSAFLGRFTGAVPAAEVVNIPFLFNDEAHLRASVKTGSAMRNLLDGAILDALAFNPLVVASGIAFLFGGLLAPLWAWRDGKVPDLDRSLPMWVRIALVTLILANWVYLIFALPTP